MNFTQIINIRKVNIMVKLKIALELENNVKRDFISIVLKKTHHLTHKTATLEMNH